MAHRILRTHILTPMFLIAAACGCNARPPREAATVAVPSSPPIASSAGVMPIAGSSDLGSPGTIQEEAPAPPAPPIGPARSHHALTIIRLAENLQAAGKVAQAVEFYRDAVKKHPGTVEAEDASTRIVALGGKVPDPSEYAPMDEPGPDPPRVRKPAKAAARPAVEAEAPSTWAAAPRASSGGSSAVYVGPRGGVYHYSKNGNKVYHSRK